MAKEPKAVAENVTIHHHQMILSVKEKTVKEMTKMKSVAPLISHAALVGSCFRNAATEHDTRIGNDQCH